LYTKQPAEGACFYEISSISEKHAPQHAWRLWGAVQAEVINFFGA